MRLKYRKMMLLFSMGIMGVAMITISFDKPTKANISIGEENAKETISKNIVTPSIAPTNTVTPAPTFTPTPTPDPMALKKNAYPEINELIETFYQAKLDSDEETLKKITNDSSDIDIAVITRKTEYIVGYTDFVCYTKPGIKEGDYVVYYTYNMDIVNIETNAPSFDQCYVTTVDGKPYISFEKDNKDIEELLKEYEKDPEVCNLKTKVDMDLVTACSMDSDLNEFYENIKAKLEEAKKNNK